MKREYVRRMFVFGEYFKDFRKTLSREALKKLYRVFCCFDEGALVILFNGFCKKTQKTPRIQIDKAKQLMELYFEQKKVNHGK